MSRYRHLLGAALLALFLGAPYLPRLIAYQLEVYPSVVQPAGANVVSSAGGIFRFHRVDFLGVDRVTGQLARMDPIQIAAPMPTSYLGPIEMHRFGLDPDLRLRISIKRLRRFFGTGFDYPVKPRSEEDRARTRAWIRGKLEAAGMQPDKIVTRRLRVAIDLRTGEIMEETILNEATFPTS